MQLARLLHDSGRYRVRVACLNPRGVLREEVERPGLGDIPAYPLTSFYDLNALGQLRRFAGFLREHKIDLVQTHDFYTNVFGMLGAALARVPVRNDVAMTGEITLRGKVLPVGGIKEKLLAAHRVGVSTLIIPKENEKDLAEVPEEVRTALTVHLVETIDEVLALALEDACPTDAATDASAQPPIWTAEPPAPGAPTMADQ